MRAETASISLIGDPGQCGSPVLQVTPAFRHPNFYGCVVRKALCQTQEMAACIVSYVDTSGIRHSVEVEVNSPYEAAAIKVCKQHNFRAARLHNY